MAQTPTGGNSGEFFAMGESLTEQCRMEVEGLRVMNFFSRRRSNDGLDIPRILLKDKGAFGNADTGGAWLLSARARKVRMTSSHHALYALGDTRATMDGTKDRDLARVS
ncbi:hypothetical protein E2542_SST17430 [Spatholobus suberectus]|nr:hypothetical protein E2542_SST17430 [Spatholobus suberectus]